MKTTIENKKGWIGKFAYMAVVIAFSQVFMACGSKGGSSATPIAVPIGPGIGLGVNNFNYSSCGTGTPGLIACAIGTVPGGEVLMQISSPNGQAAYGGVNGYSGPVIVNGVVNVLPGYSCPGLTSYSFTGNLNYYGTFLNNFEGTVAATSLVTGATSQLQITFLDTFLTFGSGVSSQGQSFPYRLTGPIAITSGMGIMGGMGGMGGAYGGFQQSCNVSPGQYVLN